MIEEGITSYYDWADRLEAAFPGRGEEATKKFEGVVIAGKDYYEGRIMWGNCFDGQYADLISSWAVWCIEQNDSLKKATWI